MEELQAKFVPVYVFDESIKDTANFAQVENVMVQIGDKYIINPAAVDSVKLLEVSEDDDAVLGDENAPVTIVEFSEFECPFCAKFYDGAYQQIKEKYVETGKVKIIFRDFPLSFHANAQKAAEATECAEEQGKFWEMHDTLFENQASIAVDDLKKYAVDLGLDAEAFNACLDSGKYAEEIEKDMNDGAALGVSGTPGFFINGIKLSGAQPFENFEAIIESELN